MESAKPVYTQAKEFAEGVLNIHPTQLLSYNLSPSFNWDAAGMTDAEIGSFITDLGTMGYVWQFITLAGFHCDALGIDLFARDFAARGMLAYVEGIQRQERANKVETLAHQVRFYDAGLLVCLILSLTGCCFFLVFFLCFFLCSVDLVWCQAGGPATSNHYGGPGLYHYYGRWGHGETILGSMPSVSLVFTFLCQCFQGCPGLLFNRHLSRFDSK